MRRVKNILLKKYNNVRTSPSFSEDYKRGVCGIVRYYAPNFYYSGDFMLSFFSTRTLMLRACPQAPAGARKYSDQQYEYIKNYTCLIWVNDSMLNAFKHDDKVGYI